METKIVLGLFIRLENEKLIFLFSINKKRNHCMYCQRKLWFVLTRFFFFLSFIDNKIKILMMATKTKYILIGHRPLRYWRSWRKPRFLWRLRSTSPLLKWSVNHGAQSENREEGMDWIKEPMTGQDKIIQVMQTLSPSDMQTVWRCSSPKLGFSEICNSARHVKTVQEHVILHSNTKY